MEDESLNDPGWPALRMICLERLIRRAPALLLFGNIENINASIGPLVAPNVKCMPIDNADSKMKLLVRLAQPITLSFPMKRCQ